MSDWLIINPAAGGGKARQRAPEVVEALQARGPLTVRETQGPQDATRFATEAALTGATRLYVLGGDGTAHEAVNGVIKGLKEERAHQLPLAFLPVGTGNSFVRDLGYSTLDEAMRRTDAGRERRVDVLRYHAIEAKGYSLNLLGVGFIAEVCDLTNRWLKPLGPAGYGVGVFAQLATLATPLITVRIDGVQHIGPSCMVAVCNSRYTGGAMKIAPDAKIDDGLLDVILVGGLDRTELMMLFPRIFLGSHTRHPKVKTFRAKRVEIEGLRPRLLMPDGEVMGRTPLSCEVLPGALTVVG